VSPRLRLARALRCRRRFLRIFPGGFRDDDYLELERDYKWRAHLQWREDLGPTTMSALLRAGEHRALAGRAVRIESRTNLLFSFEKMALRDAVRSPAGAEAFATGLHEYLHGGGALVDRFERWVEVVARLPRRQTRVLTWPVLTVFGFLADPRTHMFLKPNVTKVAAHAYGFDFAYQPRPLWVTYQSLLRFAAQVRRDLRDLGPRDQIDIQGFLWVQGSEEYEE